MSRLKIEKSLALAAVLFPHEEWTKKEANIWVAKSRLIEEHREPNKWAKEISQARILTDRGSVAFFLPEKNTEGQAGLRCADTVIDGELKTRHDDGSLICFFESSAELHSWTYGELRAMIGRK